MKENQIKSIIHKKFRNYNKSDDTRNILKRNFDTEKLNEKIIIRNYSYNVLFKFMC